MVDTEKRMITLAHNLFRRLLKERLPVDDVQFYTVFMTDLSEIIVDFRGHYSIQRWIPADVNNEDVGEWKNNNFTSVRDVVKHLVKFYAREKLL